MKTKLLILALLLMPLQGIQAKDLATGAAQYKHAMGLLQKDSKKHAAEVLGTLKAARASLLKTKELGEEGESMLQKINSHIYWQSKFATPAVLKKSKSYEKKARRIKAGKGDAEPIEVDENKEEEKGPGRMEKSAVKEVPEEEEALEEEEEQEEELLEAMEQGGAEKVSNEDWNKLKASREAGFDNDLKAAEAFEAKHGKDAMSNMLNYLNLQVKVVDLDQAQELMKKTEEFNSKLLAERKQHISHVTDQIRDFKDMLNKKQYKDIAMNVARQAKLNKKIPAKAKPTLKMFYMEMLAMANVKNRLLGLGGTRAVPMPRIPGQPESNAVNFESKGITVQLNDGQRSFLSWNVVSEDDLLALGGHIMDPENKEDLFALGLSNLRLKNYEQAYHYFENLVKVSPQDYFKFKDYLAICEAGYRLKFGPRFEGIFKEATTHASRGHKREALETLVQFRDDFLETPLGSSYMNRFKIIFYDIMRRS